MGLDNYYDNPAVSQSKLKLLLSNPKLFDTIEEPEMYFEEKKHFIIGSAVDCLLTQGKEQFEIQYHISDLENKPSDTIKSMINQIFDVLCEQFSIEDIGSIVDPIYRPIILQSCNQHSYQSNWKDDTRINKVCEAWEYWEDLKQAFGKQVLSQEENDLISQIVMSIRTNPATSKYFNPKSMHVEIIFQMPIEFTCSDNLLQIGKYGRPSFYVIGTTATDNYLTGQFITIPYNEIKGFHNLIEDYKWYLENGFEKSRKVVEAQDEFNLDWEGII